MALAGMRFIGRSGTLAGAARAQMEAFARWVLDKMPIEQQIGWASPGHDFTFYIGNYYRTADGYAVVHPERAARQIKERRSFHIRIHLDRRVLCNPFALVDSMVHEIRHASDYEWQLMLDHTASDAFRLQYGTRRGMKRSFHNREAVNRGAEARARRAVEAFHRDVRDREIVEAYERIFDLTVREQMCPPHVAFRAALRRAGR